uniref:DUF4220 domain-containing protein n=1 Tax=Oryza rufipogon TaxID=4529 RepID=A0A0E0MVX8_ORYRU
MSSAGDGCIDNKKMLDDYFRPIVSGIVCRNLVLVISVIIAAVLVGAGSFSRRYWRHGSIRLLFLGAYTLFLPLVSYIVSRIKENYKMENGIIMVECSDVSVVYLLMWASLLQIVVANYCTAIATHDDEHRNNGPTVQLLLGAIWILFLVVRDFWQYTYSSTTLKWLIAIPCALNIAKILAKLCAHEMSRRSFEVGGRNTQLITGYMEGDKHGIPLILMGEDKQKVEKGPRGYRFTDDSANSSTLVTMDSVANMASIKDGIVSSFKSGQPFEDLCLSFSLFKLLRQRFTRCPLVEEDYRRRSIPNLMIKLEQGDDAQGIVNMIRDELSFASDFYYSYLPISYSCWWLPILNAVLSSLVITYCLATQMYLGSPLVKRLIRCMLRLRCKALNHSYKMGQTSIMDTNMKIIVKAVRRLLRLSDQKMEYVEIPPEVNTAILAKFRDSNWSLPTVTASLQQSSIGNILLYGNGKGTSDVILVWHIATCIFKIKHPHEPSNAPAVTATRLSRYCAYLLSSAPELLPDDKVWSKNIYKSVKKITEPIFRKSNKGPIGYEDILQKLKEKSNDNTELKNGVALGKQLVDETRDAEQEGWEILAGFWSAMVLYIAPSDNVGAHREAIARGGELITILWAMLTHAGIISRPRTGHAV